MNNHCLFSERCGGQLKQLTDVDECHLAFVSVNLTSEEAGCVQLEKVLEPCTWATCLSCSEQLQKSRQDAKKKAPKCLFLEFGGSSCSLEGAEQDVAWGSAKFQPRAFIHHDKAEMHLFSSVRDEEGEWWRIEDYCFDDDLCICITSQCVSVNLEQHKFFLLQLCNLN